ncbi:MAG: hypothetical protein LBI48_01550 [Burkholderiaceae bacterium]|jgi:hypothetical protein|nr:hypothetical protein [Burkholderiaceae bacterium]
MSSFMSVHATVRCGTALAFGLGLLAAAGLCSGPAAAACQRQDSAAAKVWRPSVKDEFAASQYVVEGVVQAEKTALGPSAPPLMTLYTVQVLRSFKGKPGKTIVLTSKHTSERFPMSVGTKYLLFVQKELISDSGRAASLHWYVYDCGNSDALDLKQDALREVMAMNGQIARPKRAKRQQRHLSTSAKLRA